MDRDAVSDALIDLERLIARIDVGPVDALKAPYLLEQLTNIHARIVTACGLED